MTSGWFFHSPSKTRPGSWRSSLKVSLSSQALVSNCRASSRVASRKDFTFSGLGPDLRMIFDAFRSCLSTCAGTCVCGVSIPSRRAASNVVASSRMKSLAGMGYAFSTGDAGRPNGSFLATETLKLGDSFSSSICDSAHSGVVGRAGVTMWFISLYRSSGMNANSCAPLVVLKKARPRNAR